MPIRIIIGLNLKILRIAPVVCAVGFKDKELTMIKRLFPVFCVSLLSAVLFFTACDDFYSKSWGSQRDYNASNITINAGNVDSWIETAAGNPELANLLTEKIISDLKTGKLSDADKAKLQEAGAKLAVEGSGLGTGMINNSDTILKNLKEDDDKAKQGLTDAMQNIMEDSKALDDLKKGANNLCSIVRPTETGAPKITGDYKPSPADAGEAVMVLAMAVIGNRNETIGKNGVALDSIESVDPSLRLDNGKVVIKEGESSAEAILLAAYLNLIVDGGKEFSDNSVTGAIKDAFGLK
jgi:hypothetical protein